MLRLRYRNNLVIPAVQSRHVAGQRSRMTDANTGWSHQLRGQPGLLPQNLCVSLQTAVNQNTAE